MEAHGQNSAICPGCQRISRSRHSWYWRSLRDLPVQATQVIASGESSPRTLKQDLSAVEAAVSEPWSNGPVEGQLNRLKMLKRQMYGRAGIELLRARLLPEPAFSDP